MGKTPTDLVERKRSLPVVLPHELWLQEVRYFLLEDPDGVPFLESLARRRETHPRPLEVIDRSWRSVSPCQRRRWGPGEPSPRIIRVKRDPVGEGGE